VQPVAKWQILGDERSKENDFRGHLNVLINGVSLTDSGMAFQMTGDEWGKRCTD